VVDGGVDAAEEEMKVKLEDGKIVLFSKRIDPSESVGEYIGLSYIPRRLRAKCYPSLKVCGTVENWIDGTKTL